MCSVRILSDEFHKFKKIVLHGIVTDHLNYHKLSSYWVPKMLMEVHKTKQLGSALTFLTQYSDEGDEFSNIFTDDENWVCHVISESKQQLIE